MCTVYIMLSGIILQRSLFKNACYASLTAGGSVSGFVVDSLLSTGH